MTRLSNLSVSAIKDAAKSLRAGHLVAFPTETVYGLGADACNEKAVARIYEVKGRPLDHPVIVHIASVKNLGKWVTYVPEYAEALSRAFWPGPLTLILPRTGLAKDFITGGQDKVGIRVPDHEVALTLLEEFESLGGLGIAAPSANRFGKVSPTQAQHVESDLSEYLSSKDSILDGGRSKIGVESTIIDCSNSSPLILRPGGITISMINELLGMKIQYNYIKGDTRVRASGSLSSHYSPVANVYLSGKPRTGDGFIALSKFETPSGVIRLASPNNNQEYAKVLYQALKLADSKKLKKIFVIQPEGDDIASAIRDRLSKAAKKNNN
jgi:L-threonylcarbamoyladenylate synthase